MDGGDVDHETARVAIVHEWLTNVAGSEKCVDAMRQAFPRHTIFTSVFDGGTFPDWEADVRPSALQRLLPASRSHLAVLPLVPLAMAAMRLPATFDLVVRSFHSFATYPRVAGPVPELLYCHTPPRFLHRAGSLGGERLRVRVGTAAAGAVLRRSDRRRFPRHARVLANATHIAQQVSALYGVECGVLPPPVDVERFARSAHDDRGDHYVFCSRLVPYKRPDIAIEAFGRLGLPLLVVGEGRLEAQLRSGAAPNVRFLGHLPDDELTEVVGRARGFVFPGEEDFGIAAVEALAAGTPVIAYGGGGALDYVHHGSNGILVGEQSPAAFGRGVREADETTWDHGAIQASAQRFATERFVSAIRAIADELLAS